MSTLSNVKVKLQQYRLNRQITIRRQNRIHIRNLKMNNNRRQRSILSQLSTRNQTNKHTLTTRSQLNRRPHPPINRHRHTNTLRNQVHLARSMTNIRIPRRKVRIITSMNRMLLTNPKTRTRPTSIRTRRFTSTRPNKTRPIQNKRIQINRQRYRQIISNTHNSNTLPRHRQNIL